MANIKSQIKRNRQSERRRQRNRIFRGEARTAIKDARASIEDGNAEESKRTVLKAIATLDKAAQQGVLHKNNAARRKSRLVRKLALMEPKAVQARVEPAPEPQAEVVEEPKPKKATRAAKSAAAKASKPKESAVSSKKPAAEPSPKSKKPAAKKPAAKKTTKTSSPKGTKKTAKKE